ncbi:retinitis pigmentosa 9 protein isoform X1 [Myxocyprinus asiaticus]|uniref:retinitis pigmentosa 9 protein isoform X1 n=1 Tax=Myxocyprinus asiaticus TaxID=70543 RepID=UPI00222198A9|nr:retinitis pigmentosa 9 protein isoform X1 [Myxocyprinus asiaticus]
MSDRKRSREHHEDRHERKKHKSKQEDDKYKNQTKKLIQEVQKIKHVETFYENPPPGLIKEEDDKPEDCIPDDPGNEDARKFLAHAPTKGLWMPLGKEVKVMQCWRCKRYGHRTGDKECPFFIKGNQKLEQFRVAHEDPMYDIIRENKRNEKETRIQQLKQLLQDTTSDSDSSSSASSDHARKKKKKKKEKRKKEKKQKKKKKKHKAKGSDDRQLKMNEGDQK